MRYLSTKKNGLRFVVDNARRGRKSVVLLNGGKRRCKNVVRRLQDYNLTVLIRCQVGNCGSQYHWRIFQHPDADITGITQQTTEPSCFVVMVDLEAVGRPTPSDFWNGWFLTDGTNKILGLRPGVILVECHPVLLIPPHKTIVLHFGLSRWSGTERFRVLILAFGVRVAPFATYRITMRLSGYTVLSVAFVMTVVIRTTFCSVGFKRLFTDDFICERLASPTEILQSIRGTMKSIKLRGVFV